MSLVVVVVHLTTRFDEKERHAELGGCSAEVESRN